MAEVLGTVASGLHVAALAAKIISIGFKVRTLYNQMQGASAEITASLEEINILAQILEELAKSPMATHGVLMKARLHCEKCLQELEPTLRTLERNVQTSQGFLSKLLRLNVIIRKDTLTKMEHRLETALRIVLLAIQLAVFSSQGKIE